MRSRKTIAALALAGGLAAPVVLAASPAAAMAASCRVELYDIDAGSPAERDGQDELRFIVQGNLFPRFDDTHYPMRSGDDGDPADFENPTATPTARSPISTSGLGSSPHHGSSGCCLAPGLACSCSASAGAWPCAR